MQLLVGEEFSLIQTLPDGFIAKVKSEEISGGI